MRSCVLSLIICCGVSMSACRRPPPVADCVDRNSIVLPPGFCAHIFAEGLEIGRHVSVAEDGRVFVIRLRPLDETDAPTAVTAIRDSDGDRRADSQQQFGRVYGSDIEWRNPFLYVSSPLRVVRYRFGPDELIPSGEPETVVRDFPQAFGMEHPSRPFAFDAHGRLYVHVGAPSNSCQQENRYPGSVGLSPCPFLDGWAGIWRFPADRVGLKFPADGEKVVGGLRHTLGLTWNLQSKTLHFVQQGRDELHDLFPQKYSQLQGASLPAEELHQVVEGADLGWPYCYFDHIQGKRMLAPEYGGDGTLEGDCAKYAVPLLAFPAHTSPSDILAYSGQMFPERYRGGVFVSFAGGWGRRPYDQLGYNVAFVPLREGQPPGRWEVFADGFAGKASVRVPVDAAHRPAGLSQMPDGSLLILDGRKGRLWRIYYSNALLTQH